MLKQFLSTILLLSFTIVLLGQDGPPENWFNLDYSTDGVHGVSTERTYKELLSDKTGRTVVVAIIDSGVEPEHEDLNSVMWVNPGEIPGNEKDDDGNGYVDDLYGWNFIGGKDGNNVHHETYEVTRLYARDRYKYENADRDKLTKKQIKEYDAFIGWKKTIDKEREKAEKNLAKIKESKSYVESAINALDKMVGDYKLSAALIDSLEKLEKPELMIGINIFREATASGEIIEDVDDMKVLLEKEMDGAMEYFNNKLEFAYNPDFNSRTIVGDNYANQTEKVYGNNDVEGPDAMHGTHVAGIVAAARNNGVGMNGVAKNVAIMSVRAVPDGDERDKDVANSIRYAVDNGASIINMSFGKGQSWNKEIVDEAVKYAAEHDVLLVHAAGNSHQDNDVSGNFPTDKFEKKGFFCQKSASNWIEVGALSYKEGEDMIASFSNFGKEEVDVFSPGVAIYSTFPDGKYGNLQGTSMAAPVVAGIAAVIRSHYPDLTAEQVKNIIIESTVPIDHKVRRPSDKKLVSAKEISVSGGIVNLYRAVELAEKTKGKRKKKTYKSDSYHEVIINKKKELNKA
jgi:subtilisin family serine protease